MTPEQRLEWLCQAATFVYEFKGKSELAHLKFTTRRRRRCALIHGPMRACRFSAFAFRSTISGTMRAETDAAKLMAFMAELGNRVRGPGRIYFAGGATALLHGWRSTTIDVDLKPDPEPPGLFEALAVLKDELDINVELASPDQFIPAVPGWRERSLSIARHGQLEFFHYDPYGQTLSKLQRRHDRDIQDARSFLRDGLIDVARLLEMFEQIEPELIRYPAVDAASFRSAVLEFCDENK